MPRVLFDNRGGRAGGTAANIAKLKENLMHRSTSIRTVAVLVAANLLTPGFVQSAGAGVISTEAALQMEERAERIERIHSVLARDSVREQLVRFGVDAADAERRVASLSDGELQELEQRMNELPAGAGALEVLGIVLLVLLVLELVGVTDVFKSL